MNTSPWNKGRIVGQKRSLQISYIWGIRILLELESKTRDLTPFFMWRWQKRAETFSEGHATRCYGKSGGYSSPILCRKRWPDSDTR